MLRFLVVFVGVACLTGSQAANPHGADIEDNDFAEFEEFDEDDMGGGDSLSATTPAVDLDAELEDEDDEEDASVEEEDEEEEFEHLNDEDEFVGYDKEQQPPRQKGPAEKPPDLKINKVPYTLRTNWDSFYLELLMIAGLAVYCINFLAGKSKNQRLAQAWLASHRELLEANFAIVGDDGAAPEVTCGALMKESEAVYQLWCSGRVCCEGMLVTLRLLKRQDLVSTLARIAKPVADQVIVKVVLDEGEMDTFIFFLANKKVCAKLHKENTDLALFCQERRPGERLGLPKAFQVLVEPPEIAAQVLDPKMVAAITKFEAMIEYIHFSDVYSGARQQDQDQEESQSQKAPDTQKCLIFAFNVPGRGSCSPSDMAAMEPLLKMVFHCIDKMKRIRLSREAKLKTERRRQKVEESYVKASHAARVEAAQTRREEKKRAEKEKIMEVDDPDKQRKWEDRESRREMKKKQGKSKMMKVKAM